MQHAAAELSDIPPEVQWKADILFRGVRFSQELADAVVGGAAPNFWPYRKRSPEGQLELVPIPYLFRLATGAVARVRIDDASPLVVRAGEPRGPFVLADGDAPLCPVEFVRAHAWQSFRTQDGSTPSAAGVEQLGDMLVVNVTPGCDYFRVRDASGHSCRCAFCAYGRFDKRSLDLGQERGQAAPNPVVLARLQEVLEAAAASGEARHVYITGGSTLDPADEEQRYLPIIETARRAVGDRLRVTCGSGAVDVASSRRFRDAGADSCCYNLETWDADTFRSVCPGKSTHVGRDRWIDALLGAVDVFGRGNVASAFVAGVELVAPASTMSPARMVESILEGATFLLDHGIMPVYSPLWPVDGTAYRPEDGLTAELYLRLERDVFRLREARKFPVPAWLTCPGCSYMLLEVDFDRAFGLA